MDRPVPNPALRRLLDLQRVVGNQAVAHLFESASQGLGAGSLSVQRHAASPLTHPASVAAIRPHRLEVLMRWYVTERRTEDRHARRFWPIVQQQITEKLDQKLATAPPSLAITQLRWFERVAHELVGKASATAADQGAAARADWVLAEVRDRLRRAPGASAGVELAFEKAFMLRWDRVRQKPLSERLGGYALLWLGPGRILLVESVSKTVVGSTLRDPRLKAAWERSASLIESELLAALLAAPASLETWNEAVGRCWSFEKYGAYRQYRERVDDRLVGARRRDIERKLTEKRLLRPGERLETLVGSARTIIDVFRGDFLTGTNYGLHEWDPPSVRTDDWPKIVNYGGVVAAAIGGVIATVFTGGVALGTIFVAAGTFADIAGSVWQAEEADLAARKERLARRLVEQIVRGTCEAVAQRIEAQQDVLAAICVERALAEGIRPGGLTESRFRKFVWRQLFPDFPEFDSRRERIGAHVARQLHDQIGPILSRLSG